MTEASLSVDASVEALVAQVADEFRERQKQGEQPDIEEYAARHPEAAPLLRKVLASLRLMGLSMSGGAAAVADGMDEALGEKLGDFQVIREIGRGGMGVVYEAEQLSLKRRVALKVLPFAAVMDPRQLQRFHNEAQAAASLHHTNIVPVHAVGSERGVHYYAMQYIDGLPLSAVIQELRSQRRLGAADSQPQPANADQPTTACAGALSPGAQFGTPARSAREDLAGGSGWCSEPDAETARLLHGALSTKLSATGREFFHTVAQLGEQAALALDHAHERGIVHRDIKPANLLLDGAGTLWVTDFGLAQVQSDTRLTLTGDLVGTLRYMSPEQALAKRVIVDHRADIYSLGATLYELLTLEAVFAGKDRQELMRQIAFEEPRPPRRVNKAIPAELETIILKALEKNPAERYGTAQELAHDLRRFLDDRPIQARRASLRQQAGRWCRRHKSLVAAVLAALAMGCAVLAGGLGWVARDRAMRQGDAERRAADALGRIHVLVQQENWPEGLREVQQAEGFLAGFEGETALRQQARELRRDLEMAARLQEAQLRGADVKNGKFTRDAIAAEYKMAFQVYGLDLSRVDVHVTADEIRSRLICQQLLAALYRWIDVWSDEQGWKHGLALIRAADADQWRNRFLDALEIRDSRAMGEMIDRYAGEDLPAPTVALLVALAMKQFLAEPPVQIIGREPRAGGSGDTGQPSLNAKLAGILERARRRRPYDFWINESLGMVLWKSNPPRLEEAVRVWTTAVALRPESPGAHYNLGNALRDRGRLDEAIAEFQETIRLKKDYLDARNNLGNALQDMGRLDEAIAEYREAILLKKDDPVAHNNLGNALRNKRQLEQAVAEFREAIRLKQDVAEVHNNLGNALAQQGKLEEGISEYREAIRLDKDLPAAHANLGNALLHKGQLDAAIAAYQAAIRLKQEVPTMHYNIGWAHMKLGRIQEAIADYREAIRLKDDYPRAHCNLGHMLLKQGQFADALAALRRGHELGSKQPGWPVPSADWVREAERFVGLDAKLPHVLKGDIQPANAEELLAFAKLCQENKGLFCAALQFYRAAFSKEPKLAADLQQQHRYNAACAAALAGCGQGKDATQAGEKERARFRGQARDWLQADLAAWRQLLDKAPDQVRGKARQTLQHWQQDVDFAGVRSADALSKLSEAERQEWQKLWMEVEALRQRTAGSAESRSDLP